MRRIQQHGVHAVKTTEQLRRQHVPCPAESGYTAAGQRQHPVGKAQGVLGIVGGEDNGVAPAGQLLDAPQHPQLVAVVQRGRGFVHHQNVRLLAQRPGNKHHLLLAAGQLRKAAGRQMGHTQLLQRGHGLLLLLSGGGAERRQLAGQAHQRRIQHGVTEGGAVYLGDVGDMRRQRPLIQRPGVPSVQQDGAAVVRQAAEDTAKQRALSGAVGAEDGQQLSRLRRERDIFQGGMTAPIGVGKAVDGQLHRRSSPFIIR